MAGARAVMTGLASEAAVRTLRSLTIVVVAGVVGAPMLSATIPLGPRRFPAFPLRGRRDVAKSRTSWRRLLARAEARLSKAYQLLGRGLEDEAGEEAWRATIDALNALAVALWGYEIHSHEGLGKLVGKLYEHGIVDVRVEFGNAVSLHKNYYHPWMDRTTVEANIGQVRRLIEKVEKVIKQSIEEKLVPPFTLNVEVLTKLLEQAARPLEAIHRIIKALP